MNQESGFSVHGGNNYHHAVLGQHLPVAQNDIGFIGHAQAVHKHIIGDNFIFSELAYATLKFHNLAVVGDKDIFFGKTHTFGYPAVVVQ